MAYVIVARGENWGGARRPSDAKHDTEDAAIRELREWRHKAATGAIPVGDFSITELLTNGDNHNENECN